jgi:hypothetical protein
LGLLFILVLFSIGCEDKKEIKYIEVKLPNIEKDFENFIEDKRDLINQIKKRLAGLSCLLK